MSHLDERTLERLVNTTATPADVQRILRHVGTCRACARRLEEWRDTFTDIDDHFPDLSLELQSAATVTAGGLVLLPTEEPKRGFEIDLATILWIAAVGMAVLVGYGASRLRHANDGMDVAVAVRPGVTATMPRPVSRPSTTPPAAIDSSLRAPASVTSADPTPTPNPPASRSAPTPTPATPTPPTRPARDTVPTRTATSPNFSRVRRADAVRRLGGPLRGLNGLEADHIEVGPPSAVPGAQRGLDVVRMVYRLPSGSVVLLDQQRIPADSSGFRPIDDPTLESGETAYGTGPNGVSVATWLDEDGYRISLVAQATADSLRKLVRLVQ